MKKIWTHEGARRKSEKIGTLEGPKVLKKKRGLAQGS
jgi:hypothetical protein